MGCCKKIDDGSEKKSVAMHKKKWWTLNDNFKSAIKKSKLFDIPFKSIHFSKKIKYKQILLFYNFLIYQLHDDF